MDSEEKKALQEKLFRRLNTRVSEAAQGVRQTSQDLFRQIEEFSTVDQYTLQADAFAMAIRDGRTAALPPSDALANMAVIDAVRTAAH